MKPKNKRILASVFNFNLDRCLYYFTSITLDFYIIYFAGR